MIHKHYRKYISSKASNLRDLKNSDPKKFWKYLSGKEKTKCRISEESFYNFMKRLNQPSLDEESEHLSFDNQEIPEFNFINEPITIEEIKANVLKLSNGKSSGLDKILNEHIKTTLHILLPIYHKLFNLIFDTGIIPLAWTEGCIIPIYKNKGAHNNPENYRPITLVSCLGKLFTCILNSRLQKFAQEFDVISENQMGFRKQYSTADNIFALHMLINILHNQKRNFSALSLIFKGHLTRSGVMAYGQKY